MMAALPMSVNPIHAISAEDQARLTNSVALWETTKAVKSMQPLKALGPDGFQPLFYQKYWHIVAYRRGVC